jgi:hypothetical protein
MHRSAARRHLRRHLRAAQAARRRQAAPAADFYVTYTKMDRWTDQ